MITAFLQVNSHALAGWAGCSDDVRSAFYRLEINNPETAADFERDYENYMSLLQSNCFDLKKSEMTQLKQKGTQARRSRALFYSKILLNEARRISKFRLDADLFNEIERLRNHYELNWIEIDPRGILPAITVRGTERQQQRASSCTPVDLRNNHVPFQSTRHQGNSGWCFAYSAADLVTHYYQKNNPGFDHRFSAVGMTVDYYYNDYFSSAFESLMRRREMPRNLSNVHFGHLEAIFSRTLPSRGLCPESEVTSDRNILGHVRAIESIGDLRRRTYGDSEISESEGEDLVDEVMECAECALALNSVFPNLDMNNLIQVLRKVEDQGYMTRLTNLQCEGRRINTGIPSREQVRTSRNFRESSPEIDRVLDSNSPVLLGYHSTVINKGGDLRSQDFAGRLDGHASLIIGRRFNEATNKCEYLVRNSKGISCAGYDSSLDCSNGQFWLAEETMETAFIGALWINER